MTMLEKLVVGIVIDLSDWPHECVLCGEWDWIEWCVPFYEEPRPDLEIGQRVPGGGPDDIVGGMSCCKQCHDEIYSTPKEDQ